MDAQKLVMGVVGLAVIVLLISSLVIPVVESSMYSTATLENNENVIKYQLISTNEDVVIFYDYSEESLFVNGELVYLNPEETTYTYGIAAISDSFCVQAGSNFPFALWTKEYAYVGTDWTLTLSNGTWSSYGATEDANPKTGTYTYAYIPDTKGDYGFYNNVNSTNAVNVDKTSKVMFIRAQAHYAYTIMTSESTLSDTMTSVFYGAPSSYVVPAGEDVDISVSLTDNGLYYTVTGTSFTNPSTSTAVTNNLGIIAPIAYHEESQTSALFAIIPLLLIIVAVLYAVRLMGTSRN